MKFQALRRRHHTVSSTTGQNTAIEEAKKINMSRDKRHQTIDNSQSVSTSLFQVSQKVLRFSTDWCYEVLRFAFQHLRCILKVHGRTQTGTNYGVCRAKNVFG